MMKRDKDNLGGGASGNGKGDKGPQTQCLMSDEGRAFLEELLTTPSPTGNERTIQRLIRDRMQGVAEKITTDLHGNLMLGVHTDKKRRVMLAGHCDQLGFMVKYISPGGYITLDSLGGNDYGVLMGEH